MFKYMSPAPTFLMEYSVASSACESSFLVFYFMFEIRLSFTKMFYFDRPNENFTFEIVVILNVFPIRNNGIKPSSFEAFEVL